MPRISSQADRLRSSTSDAAPEDEFSRKCGAFRKELGVPGFWDALQQNCNQWADEISVSPFWKAVRERQPTWSNDFQRKTAGALLANPGVPSFVGKTAKRIREKMLHRWRNERID